MNVVTYKVTGILNNNVMFVEFSMEGVKETLSFNYDGVKPIKQFLEEQAMFAMPTLKAKQKSGEIDLNQFVGTEGTVTLPDTPMLPPAGPPAFTHDTAQQLQR